MNEEEYFQRSEYLWEKGTDRNLVIQGLKNKYWWVDQGSSFLPSDLLAAILFAQLECLNELQEKRKRLFEAYKEALLGFTGKGLVIPTIPDNCETNYHAFWIMLPTGEQRDLFIKGCLANSVSPYIGYIQLHSSPMGIKFGGDKYELPITDSVAERIARLPFYLMEDEEIEYTMQVVKEVISAVL